MLLMIIIFSNCCNCEISGKLGSTVNSVGILEKTYCDFTQRDEKQPDMNNSNEMVPFVHEQVQENIAVLSFSDNTQSS